MTLIDTRTPNPKSFIKGQTGDWEVIIGMQQDHRRAAAVAGVPDAGILVLHRAGLAICRQGRHTVRFKMGEVVIGEGHRCLRLAICP